jgi:hypothetical protein
VILERPALERRVLASLAESRIPVLLGACGTGRTSLLLRLARLGAERTQYLDVSAAATTPERCLAAVMAACRFTGQLGRAPAACDSPRAAFDALLARLDGARTPDDGPVTFLLDDFLDVRTFESFPGLRHVQRELITSLAGSPSHFVLASRFTARAHRLLRDAPARFEVVHVPPLEETEVLACAERASDGRDGWAESVAPPIRALAGGRAAYVNMLLGALGEMEGAVDPIAALVCSLSVEGTLTRYLRHSYEFRLHRARGYGALKAILGVLAESEPLNLTEIAQQLQRTPGSTRDYLSWLEDVDLVTVHRKRYAFEDPLLRLFVRLHGRPVPPTDEDLAREVHAYAQSRLSVAAPMPAPASPAGVDERDGEAGISLRISEID